jgi:hypothetical protein
VHTPVLCPIQRLNGPIVRASHRTHGLTRALGAYVFVIPYADVVGGDEFGLLLVSGISDEHAVSTSRNFYLHWHKTRFPVNIHAVFAEGGNAANDLVNAQPGVASHQVSLDANFAENAVHCGRQIEVMTVHNDSISTRFVRRGWTDGAHLIVFEECPLRRGEDYALAITVRRHLHV